MGTLIFDGARTGFDDERLFPLREAKGGDAVQMSVELLLVTPTTYWAVNFEVRSALMRRAPAEFGTMRLLTAACHGPPAPMLL